MKSLFRSAVWMLAAATLSAQTASPPMNVPADQIMYEVTLNEPETFTKPWTAQIPMLRTEGPIYEYACHEGNYSMEDMLRGARVEESKAAGRK